MNETKKKYNPILVIIDGFTKYVWFFPTKSTGTKETLKKMRVLLQHFGNSDRVVTDRGPCFIAGAFDKFCQEKNVDHLKITAGVPRGNGQVERVNSIVNGVLTKINVMEPTKWYKRLSKVQQAINGTYQRAVNASPYELLFGRKLRYPEDANLLELIVNEASEVYNEVRNELRDKAKIAIDKIQTENTKQFNRHRKEATKYEEGDLVAIQRMQPGAGLRLYVKNLSLVEFFKKGANI